MNRSRLARAVLGLRRIGVTLSAGFTLVELMVAITGGLFVTVAVFLLAKQATALYQSETRVGNATLGSIVGFERLRLDIARAGFLSSPNLRRDPKLCGTPVGNASWPAYLARLSSVYVFQPAPSTVASPVLRQNGIAPDELTLSGSYVSSDQFPTGHVFDSTGVIELQPLSPAMVRLGYPQLTSAGDQTALLQTVFAKGRGLRLVDTAGREQYGTIASVAGGPIPTITLDTGLKLLQRNYGGSALKCGVQGTGERSLVNVVNIVKYSVRDMTTNANYAPLFGAGGSAPVTDSGRTELVREELDTTGTPIDGTQEIVSEFAVDFKIGISVASVKVTANGTTVDRLLTYDPGDPNVVAYTGDPTTLAANFGPQLVRVVRTRLSVRSREADRETGLSAGDGGLAIGSGLYRIGLGSDGKGPFARVRTVQADVVLANQQGAVWL